MEKRLLGSFNPNFFFNGITLKTPFGTFIFKSVDVWMRKPKGWNSLHYAIFVQIFSPSLQSEGVDANCCNMAQILGSWS